MEFKEANIRQIEHWKTDSWKSVECYNNWFTTFAPQAFITARRGALSKVLLTFSITDDLRKITVENILQKPEVLEVLRMVTAPPLAQDRLIGLSYTKKTLLKTLEEGKIPRGGISLEIHESISRMAEVIKKMLDEELFPWLLSNAITSQQRRRSASIVADRLTGVLSDPMIRNAQENRQLNVISDYLKSKGYTYVDKVTSFVTMQPKTFSFHVNVPIIIGQSKKINMPIDVVICTTKNARYPLLLECKSAGDFTNTNKRRKEEAIKMAQLRETYGNDIKFCLFLCGYFDTGYLGYEAAEGIDWIWEHRISDLEKLGI